MCGMFSQSQFNGDISNWDVSNVEDMSRMFCNSSFNRDISKWKLNNKVNIDDMFKDCPIKKEYMPKYK